MFKFKKTKESNFDKVKKEFLLKMEKIDQKQTDDLFVLLGLYKKEDSLMKKNLIKEVHFKKVVSSIFNSENYLSLMVKTLNNSTSIEEFILLYHIVILLNQTENSKANKFSTMFNSLCLS